MVTFSFERGTAFVSELLGSMRLLADLVEIAKKTPAAPAPALEPPGTTPASAASSRSSPPSSTPSGR